MCLAESRLMPDQIEISSHCLLLGQSNDSSRLSSSWLYWEKNVLKTIVVLILVILDVSDEEIAEILTAVSVRLFINTVYFHVEGQTRFEFQ